MSRTRRILVGFVATLSLLGVAGAVSAAPDSAPVVSANRWCC